MTVLGLTERIILWVLLEKRKNHQCHPEHIRTASTGRPASNVHTADPCRHGRPCPHSWPLSTLLTPVHTADPHLHCWPPSTLLTPVHTADPRPHEGRPPCLTDKEAGVPNPPVHTADCRTSSSAPGDGPLHLGTGPPWLAHPLGWVRRDLACHSCPLAGWGQACTCPAPAPSGQGRPVGSGGGGASSCSVITSSTGSESAPARSTLPGKVWRLARIAWGKLSQNFSYLIFLNIVYKYKEVFYQRYAFCNSGHSPPEVTVIPRVPWDSCRAQGLSSPKLTGVNLLAGRSGRVHRGSELTSTFHTFLLRVKKAPLKHLLFICSSASGFRPRWPFLGMCAIS